MDFWARFVLAALATWRLAHLLALEDGPFDLVVRLRLRLGEAGRALDCIHCMSLWVAAPLALFVDPTLQSWWCIWLALSGAAGLLHQLGRPTMPEPMKGNDDGLLWAEAGRTGGQGDIGAGATDGRGEPPAVGGGGPGR